MTAIATVHAPGCLFYLMGSSGAGKDTLIRYARAALGQRAGVVFAHRYITRPVDGAGENHVALSEEEFVLRCEHGLFLFDWSGNGCRYGVGLEVSEWLGRGLHVVVNGSRAYLAVARERVPVLRPVLVQASAGRRIERLRSRGREDEAGMAARLERAERYAASAEPDTVVIDNDGALEVAGEALLSLLRGAPSAGAAPAAPRSSRGPG